jgi:hypothetical protein
MSHILEKLFETLYGINHKKYHSHPRQHYHHYAGPLPNSGIGPGGPFSRGPCPSVVLAFLTITKKDCTAAALLTTEDFTEGGD